MRIDQSRRQALRTLVGRMSTEAIRPGILMKDEDLVRLTSPAVIFAQIVCLIGAPAILCIFIAGGVHGQQMFMATLVVFFLSALAVWWSYVNSIETVLAGRELTRTRQLGPFRVRKTIDLADIVALRIPPYSGKLVAKLRDGQEVVVANKYAHAFQPLPDVPLTPADAQGPLHTLRRVQSLIEKRANLASGS